MWDPTKNLGPIGSTVSTFIGHKQTDKQNIYIYKIIIVSDAKTWSRTWVNIVDFRQRVYTYVWNV